MDVVVTRSEDGTEWALADLLGRAMGRIACSAGSFSIQPDGHAVETMAGMKTGPFLSLDDALAEIERHTRAVCRRDPGQDHP